MLLWRNNFDKIINGESKAEEEARLKKTHHRKILGEKRKKADIKKEDTVLVSSDSEKIIKQKSKQEKIYQIEEENKWVEG